MARAASKMASSVASTVICCWRALARAASSRCAPPGQHHAAASVRATTARVLILPITVTHALPAGRVAHGYAEQVAAVNGSDGAVGIRASVDHGKQAAFDQSLNRHISFPPELCPALQAHFAQQAFLGNRVRQIRLRQRAAAAAHPSRPPERRVFEGFPATAANARLRRGYRGKA